MDQVNIKFTPAKYEDLMKISVAVLLLLFPSVALTDYVNSGSSISDYRVYDESIKTDGALVDEDHINNLIVTYYVRITSKPKIDMYGNNKSETSVMQFAFNCATKFYGVRANEFVKFTDVNILPQIR